MLSALSVTEYVILNEKLCVTNCCRTCGGFFVLNMFFPKASIMCFILSKCDCI